MATIAPTTDRVDRTVGPAPLIAASVDDLRAAGLSGAKTRSLRDLTERVLDGRLSFERLAVPAVPPPATGRLPGGRCRPAPRRALGVRAGAAPDGGLAARAEGWRPMRSYAAALLWAHGTDRPTTRSET
jgi:3-methyladenine DNA glycosylase/8-oxoguanine DNA glycosylase